MPKIFTFACVYPSGYSWEIEAEANTEKEARKKVWDKMPDHQKNNLESFETIEIMEVPDV